MMGSVYEQSAIHRTPKSRAFTNHKITLTHYTPQAVLLCHLIRLCEESYLLGLLAMIKCSICSYQCDS